MKFRLTVIDSHPIQYRAPLFKRIAQDPCIDLFVYYYSDRGATNRLDSGFNTIFKWDITLLEDYSYKFLKWGVFGLIQALKKRKSDAVIIHGYSSLDNWIIVLLAPLLNLKIIFVGETILKTRGRFNIFFIIKHLFLKIFFKNISAFLYIGSKSKEFYQFYHIPRERLFFTPYCVDNNFFINQISKRQSQKNEIKKEIGISGELPVILYASKIIPRKRPQDLLKAFEKISLETALIFVGDGKLRPYLERYTARHKIKNVFFLGFKNQTELFRYYLIADIFVLPSEYEPWGLAINEAMCAGLPIITTEQVSAAYDLVKNEENGYIFKIGDICSLSNLLENLILHEAKRRQMGLKSLEIITAWNFNLCITGLLEAVDYVCR